MRRTLSANQQGNGTGSGSSSNSSSSRSSPTTANASASPMSSTATFISGCVSASTSGSVSDSQASVGSSSTYTVAASSSSTAPSSNRPSPAASRSQSPMPSAAHSSTSAPPSTKSNKSTTTRPRNHSRSGSAEKKFVALGQTLSTQAPTASGPETAPEADTTASESEAEKPKAAARKEEEEVSEPLKESGDAKKEAQAPALTSSVSAPLIESSTSRSTPPTSTASSTTATEQSLKVEARPRALTAIGGVEQSEMETKVRQIQAAHANRRPKMLRLTPTHPSSSASAIGLTRQAVKKRTEDAANGNELDPTTPTPASSFQQGGQEAHNILSFPSKSPVSGLPYSSSASTPPLHPGSRKALAMRAAGGATPTPTGNEPHAGLQLDLQCLPSPSIHDGAAPASTSKLPEMVRKKSGEPVKSSLKQFPISASVFVTRADSSPSSLPTRSLQNYKSAPSTPHYPTTPGASKNVHFDTHLEHVKLFKHKQKPAAVSRDGSPEQTETETEEEKDAYTKFPYLYAKKAGFSPPGSAGHREGTSPAPPTPGSPIDVEEQLVLRLPNFPSSTKLRVDRSVFLERVYLADDLRSVRGTVRVRNLAFEKWVAVRFTLDGWKTVSEVSAEWSESLSSGDGEKDQIGVDRFTFSLKLNELLNWPRGAGAHETKSMSLCLRYTAGGEEIWDNNDGNNYQLDFRKRIASMGTPSTPGTPGTPAGMASARSEAEARSRNNTLPKRHGSLAPAEAAKLVELAKRGGVHGNQSAASHQANSTKTSKGGFAMEDLRRELDRLKSDEEEEDARLASIAGVPAPRLRSAADAAMRRGSPPISPSGRAASPGAGPAGDGTSPWTSRYDFGASLKNPRTGSRTTGAGRAAALDYFSSKPTPGKGGSGNGSLHAPSSSTGGPVSPSQHRTASHGHSQSLTTNEAYSGPSPSPSPAWLNSSPTPSPLGGSPLGGSPVRGNSPTPSSQTTPKSMQFSFSSPPQVSPTRHLQPTGGKNCLTIGVAPSPLDSPAHAHLGLSSPAGSSSSSPLPLPSFQHRFGMLSPGLGEYHVEHKPSNGGMGTPSPDTSHSSSPQTGMFHSNLAPSTSSSSNSSPDSHPQKYYSYPPNRGSISPGALSPYDHYSEEDSPPDQEYASSQVQGPGSYRVAAARSSNLPVFDHTTAKLGLLDPSLSYSPIRAPISLKEADVLGSGAKLVKSDGLVLQNYMLNGEDEQEDRGGRSALPGEDQEAFAESPLTSGTGSAPPSPSIFSPALSEAAASPDSDVTTRFGSTSSSAPLRTYSPAHSASTCSLNSTASTPDPSPSVVSSSQSFNEMVAKFCWNSGNNESQSSIIGSDGANSSNRLAVNDAISSEFASGDLNGLIKTPTGSGRTTPTWTA